MLLYIIRHGDPIYNPDTLTDKGKEQAAALAKRLAVNGLDKIYCSPNGRAKETAQPTCDLLGMDMYIEDWTSENHAWNDFSAQITDTNYGWTFHVQNTEFRKPENINKSYDDWHEADAFSKIDAKKGYDRIANASDKFIETLGYKRDGGVYKIVSPSDEKTAVFCHQGFGTTWMSHLLAVPPHIFWASFDITHSSVTIIQFKNNSNGLSAPQCLCMSDISHIYKEGLPMEYQNYLKI